jgi:L-seryl-tRNA(Ser) seleniumtransferase
LRTGEPAVVGRLEQGRLLLDVRSVAPDQDEALVRAVLAAVARAQP